MGTSGRVRTYVQGFDEKVGGGIPPGHIVLLAGEAGTMKSTIAWNVLHHGAIKEDRTGAYITLEQSRDSFSAHLRTMGMDPKAVEDKVSIVDLAMIRKNLEGMAESTWLEIFKMYAHNLKKSLNYELLVVDSLTVLQTLARFERPREQMFQTVEWMRDLKATTLLINEMKTKGDEFGAFGEEFLADGIIHVKMERVDDANIQRRIRCVKMRGSAHSPNYYTLMFENGYLQATRVIAE
jgi:KaiC/GvpD/RAD55 family RecA-like ATPase